MPAKNDATKSQWIEIANAGTAAIGIGENKWALWFYQANETPRATYVKDDGTAGVLIDQIGTKTAAASITAAAVAAATTPAAKTAAATAGATQRDVYWSIAGKGQSGRSGIDIGGADVVASRPDTEASLYVSCDGSFDSRRCGSSGRNDGGRRHDGIQLDAVGTPKCQLQVRS